MKSHYLFCIILLGSFVSPLLAQGVPSQFSYPVKPPPAPEAASLAKCINFPVDYNTGVPRIEIPLFELKGRESSLPLVISYHAGGFKAKEESAYTGLGWSLSSDFQIVREIRGHDDFRQLSGYYYYEQVPFGKLTNFDFANTYTPPPPYNRLRMLNNEIDTQSDKYYYRLKGKSGCFYLRKSQNEGITLVPVPYTGIRFEVILPTGTSTLGFRVTDTDGTVYLFGGTTTTIEKNDPGTPGIDLGTYISSWKCREIISPSKLDTIQFSYRQLSSRVSYTFVESSELYENMSIPLGQPDGLTEVRRVFFADDISNMFPGSAEITLKDILKKIPFQNINYPHVINYTVSQDYTRFIFPEYCEDPPVYTETDYVDNTYQLGEMQFVNGKRVQERLVPSVIKFNGNKLLFNYNTLYEYLSSIKIVDSSQQQVREIAFTQTCVGQKVSAERNSLTNYLDKIQIVGNPSETYKFDYSSMHAFSNFTIGCDFWGGLRGTTHDRTDNVDINVPFMQIETPHYLSNNYLDQMLLNYFIGGNYLLYMEMENNVQPQYALKGLLKRITYPTGGYTDFEFECNRIDGGWRTIPSGGARVASILNCQADGTVASRKYYVYGEDGTGIIRGLHAPFSESENVFLCRQNVLYIGDTPIDEYYDKTYLDYPTALKTVIYSNAIEDLYYGNGAPIYYQKVTEYEDAVGSKYGKKEYIYTSPEAYGFHLRSQILDTNLKSFQEDWRLGKIQAENTYKYENGEYKLIHSKEYKHKIFNSGIKIHNLQSYKRNIIYMTRYNGTLDSYIQAEISDPLTLSYIERYLPVGNGLVEHFPEEINSGDILLEKITETTYDGPRQLVTTTTYTYDQQAQLNTTTVHTSDGQVRTRTRRYPYYYGTAIPFIQRMITANNISAVIEEVEEDSITSKVVSGIISRYRVDNPGQVESVSLLGSGVPGYVSSTVNKNSFVMAPGYYEKMSCTYDEVDNPVQIIDNSGLSTVYLWGYNNQYPIAEIKNASYEAVKVLLADAVVISLRKSFDDDYICSKIDLLRQHPSMNKAHVTTFIHQPLVGVIQIVSPAGQSRSYHYDTLGRLCEIIDVDGLVVQKYQYNYGH